ncbi:MAG: ADP-ribosylglycohydrolase family protein [Trueperaceae bacterium]
MSPAKSPERLPISESARGCLIGLAIGDALGQPTEGWTPDAIAAKWGYIEDLPEGTAAVSDDTEYTLFSARVLIEHGLGVTSELFADAWLEQIVPQEGPFKGAGFSEMAAIDNLKRGLRPPLSGRHYHCWSDGLAMRVAPFGIASGGDHRLAARLALEDGKVSHDGEGIYAGQAVAAAVAAASRGDSLEEVLAAAHEVIPVDSWTARNLDLTARLGAQASGARQAIPSLHDALAVDYYPWADLAPEAVGLAFGLLVAGRGDVAGTLLAAVNLGRDSDTVAAIIGAILGAKLGPAAIPERWHKVIAPASGRCLACVRGADLLETADALAGLTRTGAS